ncbi:oxygenase MpaB family protein [Nocardia sp. NPDC052566]|uniref:oxygenase MpaB family protein n=1 Tax=Nocardia sp. NPDC052566 TaxID=3364330 RepID=UPI0037C86CA9
MSRNILTHPDQIDTLRRTDYGFFGPESVAWKVWTHPTILLGLQRAVALQFLNPYFAAAHEDAKGVYQRPAHFFDMTLSFLLSGILGDSRTALTTSDFIMDIHTRVTGIEPISKKRYNANSPEAQLFTHIDGWQSMLKCYEVFGPGALPAAEETQYWAECAVAAELFTCKAEDIPRSREGVRAYYAQLRPRLCISEHALSGLRQQLYTSGPYADPKVSIISRIAAPATLATFPKWIRVLIGLDQPAVVDRISVPVVREVFHAVARSRRASWTMVGVASPMAGRILRQHWRSGEPARPEVLTPAIARQANGRPTRRSGEAALHATDPSRKG